LTDFVTKQIELYQHNYTELLNEFDAEDVLSFNADCLYSTPETPLITHKTPGQGERALNILDLIAINNYQLVP
jgi:hypothetical protein